jgi:sodium/bile acid cotransporter 7
VPVVYSLVTINFISTLLSFGLIHLPYLTKDFAIGLTIFCTVPTTLGVGVALTQLAKGDQILSLFLTVVSNLLGIVTVPFLLGIYLSNTGAIHVDPVKLAVKLTITVLLPTVVGVFARQFIAGVPTFTKNYRTQLSMISTFNLVMIVWMALSSARNTLLAQNVGEVMFVFALSVLMHVFYLCLNLFMVSKCVLHFSPKQAVSVIIMASQKSSPVALAVITSLATATTQQKGLFALPCIIGQLSQIFIGSFIAGRLVKWVDDQEVGVGAAEEDGIEMTSEVADFDVANAADVTELGIDTQDSH